ncbi:MAG: type I restriction endonuclease [Bacteroidales bacterium]|nr:type I restriction endonuclease [Lachnoclostridium sp.]MCM1385159.1 type I restriction endonuclease [Lachnoclostridium sp.]MCM1465561.1 type I restriction endonuclease [Bacteroidales bacterium]
MEFTEQIKKFAERVSSIKNTVSTEEATKMSLVVPLFQILGYDVFNPSEFCPEYTADVGIKKGEKVDYAILIDGQPNILIECKSCTETLDKHSSQLFRYFGTTPAKFGILTNGLIYRFYTDLEEKNKMDMVPFLEINMENLKDYTISELKKFCKSAYNKDNIFSTAEELKYSSLIKNELAKEYESPSDDFVRFFLNKIYEGQKNQRVIEKFAPIVKKSFSSFVNEIVNSKISSALVSEDVEETSPTEDNTGTTPENSSKIVTTDEEIQAYYIICGILAEIIPIEDVVYRDTESYFGILYKDNNRKPICRINLDTKKKQLMIPDASKNFDRYYIESLNEIYKYKDKIIDSAKKYINESLS